MPKVIARAIHLERLATGGVGRAFESGTDRYGEFYQGDLPRRKRPGFSSRLTECLVGLHQIGVRLLHSLIRFGNHESALVMESISPAMVCGSASAATARPSCRTVSEVMGLMLAIFI